MTTLQKEIIGFLERLSCGEKANDGNGFSARNPKTDEPVDEYSSSKAVLWLSLDGSNLYDAFNHYDEPNCYARDTRWTEFCKKKGLVSELGHAWSMNVYKEKDY